jgi:hypothetical protein
VSPWLPSAGWLGSPARRSSIAVRRLFVCRLRGPTPNMASRFARDSFEKASALPPPTVAENLLAVRRIWGPGLTPVSASDPFPRVLAFLMRERPGLPSDIRAAIAAVERTVPEALRSWLAVHDAPRPSVAEAGADDDGVGATAEPSPSPAAASGSAQPSMARKRKWFEEEAARGFHMVDRRWLDRYCSAQIARLTRAAAVLNESTALAEARQMAPAMFAELNKRATELTGATRSLVFDASGVAHVEDWPKAAAREWVRRGQQRELLASVQSTTPSPELDPLVDGDFAFPEGFDVSPRWDKGLFQHRNIAVLLAKAEQTYNMAVARAETSVGNVDLGDELPRIQLERERWFTAVVDSLMPLYDKHYAPTTASGKAYRMHLQGKLAAQVVEVGTPATVAAASREVQVKFAPTADAQVKPPVGIEAILEKLGSLQKNFDRLKTDKDAEVAARMLRERTDKLQTAVPSPGRLVAALPSPVRQPVVRQKDDKKPKASGAQQIAAATVAGDFAPRPCVQCAVIYSPSNADQKACTSCRRDRKRPRFAKN